MSAPAQAAPPREMKDSGVEWIGEIPKEWEIKKGKFLFSCQFGFPFDSANFSNTDGFPLLRIRDITAGFCSTFYQGEYDSQYIVRKGDILVGMDGDFNVRCWDSGECLLNQRCCRVLPHSDTVGRFIYYQLPAILEKINLFKYATTVKHLAASDVASENFTSPSQAEQQRIAAYLDRKCGQIDAIIEKQKQVIEKLKAYKLSVITEAVTKGLDPNVDMKDSGVEWIGMVPKSWHIIKSARVIETTQNGLTRRNFSDEVGQIVLKLRNIHADGYIDYSSAQKFVLTQVEINNYALSEGDFLFVRVNGSKALVGKCAIFGGSNEIVAYNDHIIRVRLNGSINRMFFFWYLQSYAGRQEIEKYTITAAGQHTINGTGLRSLVVSLPSAHEQEQICHYLDKKCAAIASTIASKETLIAKLAAYKKSLIYELVTGKRAV